MPILYQKSAIRKTAYPLTKTAQIPRRESGQSLLKRRQSVEKSSSSPADCPVHVLRTPGARVVDEFNKASNLGAIRRKDAERQVVADDIAQKERSPLLVGQGAGMLADAVDDLVLGETEVL